MTLFPWWVDIILLAVLVYLAVKVIKLSRESKKLKNIVCKLEGAEQLEECREVGHGDSEGQS